jgi:hypothetical protein
MIKLYLYDVSRRVYGAAFDRKPDRAEGVSERSAGLRTRARSPTAREPGRYPSRAASRIQRVTSIRANTPASAPSAEAVVGSHLQK